jgi:hypothetical protein
VLIQSVLADRLRSQVQILDLLEFGLSRIRALAAVGWRRPACGRARVARRRLPIPRQWRGRRAGLGRGGRGRLYRAGNADRPAGPGGLEWAARLRNRLGPRQRGRARQVSFERAARLRNRLGPRRHCPAGQVTKDNRERARGLLVLIHDAIPARAGFERRRPNQAGLERARLRVAGRVRVAGRFAVPRLARVTASFGVAGRLAIPRLARITRCLRETGSLRVSSRFGITMRPGIAGRLRVIRRRREIGRGPVAARGPCAGAARIGLGRQRREPGPGPGPGSLAVVAVQQRLAAGPVPLDRETPVRSGSRTVVRMPGRPVSRERLLLPAVSCRVVTTGPPVGQIVRPRASRARGSRGRTGRLRAAARRGAPLRPGGRAVVRPGSRPVVTGLPGPQVAALDLVVASAGVAVRMAVGVTVGAAIAVKRRAVIAVLIRAHLTRLIGPGVAESIRAGVADAIRADVADAIRAGVADAIRADVADAIRADIAQPLRADVAEPVGPLVTRLIPTGVTDMVLPGIATPAAVEFIARRVIRAEALVQAVRTRPRAGAAVAADRSVRQLPGGCRIRPAGRLRLRAVAAVAAGPGDIGVGTAAPRVMAAFPPSEVAAGCRPVVKSSLAIPGLRASAALVAVPLGLGGVPVGGGQDIRPHRPEIAEPFLGGRFPELRLSPPLRRFPAEYHLCRHSATSHHRQRPMITRSVREDHHQAPARRAPQRAEHKPHRPTIACGPTGRNLSTPAKAAGQSARKLAAGRPGRELMAAKGG